MGAFRFRLYAMDGDDPGTRTFSEPTGGSATSSRCMTRCTGSYDVRLYLDDDGDVRGLMRLEKRRRAAE